MEWSIKYSKDEAKTEKFWEEQKKFQRKSSSTPND